MKKKNDAHIMVVDDIDDDTKCVCARPEKKFAFFKKKFQNFLKHKKLSERKWIVSVQSPQGPISKHGPPPLLLMNRKTIWFSINDESNE